jgi:multiple sugar transport system substrate-binding protein
MSIRKRGGKAMKKILSLFLVLILSIALFAGCGETTQAPAEKVTVKFAVQPDNTDALVQIIDAFNAENDSYQVETVILTNDSGNMHDLLLNSLSSNSAEYDVISMDVVWAGEFAAAGYLQPLDAMIKDAGWAPTDFNAGSMASGKYKGKNYVLPYFPDLGFLYYRSDIVDQGDAAKLQSGDYTWEDLLTMAEGYAGEGGTKYGHVYQSKQYEGLTCNVNEFTSNWSDVENGLAIMKQFADSAATPKDILVYTEGETHNAFLNGESVFARNWPYMNGMAASGEYTIDETKIGRAPLPNGGTVGGWILGVNTKSERQEAAKVFIRFLAGPEGQKINATVGSYLPGFNALLNDNEVKASNVLLTDPGFQNALKKTIARPVAENYSEVSDTIQINAHAYLSGNGDLADAVSAIEEALK